LCCCAWCPAIDRHDDPAGRLAGRHRRLRAFYGLDQSIPQQFITWSGQALSGHFGRSISLHQQVFELVLARLPRRSNWRCWRR